MVAPAGCICCRAHDKKVIDFGVSFDFEGAVYFCVDCLTESAGLIGLIPVQALEASVAVSNAATANSFKAESLIQDFLEGLESNVNSLCSTVSVVLTGATDDMLPGIEESGEDSVSGSLLVESSPGNDDKSSTKDNKSRSVKRPPSFSTDSGDDAS
jgi:hypothetical protein